MTKRKLIYLIVTWISLLGAILVIAWLFPTHAFTLVSQDGVGPGLGAGGRGVGSLIKIWESPDEVRINEVTVTYASIEDAQQDYQEELKRFETIIERKKKPDYFSKAEERVIGTVVNHESQSRTVKLIELQEKQIYVIEGPAEEYVMGFRRSWLKLGL